VEDLVRNWGWYLSVAIFSLIGLGIAGWLIAAVLRFFFGKERKGEQFKIDKSEKK
jgi:hypothetical protein